jgi:hypothetical protein
VYEGEGRASAGFDPPLNQLENPPLLLFEPPPRDPPPREENPPKNRILFLNY